MDCLKNWFERNNKCPLCNLPFEISLTEEMISEALKFFSCPELEALSAFIAEAQLNENQAEQRHTIKTENYEIESTADFKIKHRLSKPINYVDSGAQTFTSNAQRVTLVDPKLHRITLGGDGNNEPKVAEIQPRPTTQS